MAKSVPVAGTGMAFEGCAIALVNPKPATIERFRRYMTVTANRSACANMYDILNAGQVVGEKLLSGEMIAELN